jgi:hypothetical protein
LPVQQVSVTLGSLTCGEGGNLSTRDLGFIYVSSAGRVGCEFMHPAQPTDALSSRRSSRSHFYTPGFPRGCCCLHSGTPSPYQQKMHSFPFIFLWFMYQTVAYSLVHIFNYLLFNCELNCKCKSLNIN